ncbi:MAG TPA: hypothetical protein VKZ97_08160, partial [Flavobacteriaceae bacterium]|nr:hypothetical protein [Flavobacteriaceae bacterium]
TTDVTDIGVKEVKKYYLTDKPTESAKKFAEERNIDLSERDLVYFAEAGDNFDPKDAKKASDFKFLSEYLEGLSEDEKANIKEAPNYFYEVTFEKPGGLVMPIITEFTYADGTKERKTFPAQIWRYDETEVKKVFRTDKEITKITVDPDLETADVDTSNNAWPKEIQQSDFEKFKSEVKN